MAQGRIQTIPNLPGKLIVHGKLSKPGRLPLTFRQLCACVRRWWELDLPGFASEMSNETKTIGARDVIEFVPTPRPFLMRVPLAPWRFPYPQQLATVDDLRKRGLIGADGTVAKKQFVTVYVGDYDSAAWLYRRVPEIWSDPARGTIPLGWAFNPNLADRMAPCMAWVRKTASKQDVFVSGDSGAGYLNPGHLQEPRKYSGLPSGVKAWAEHCRKYYARWDISITGFVIDGYAPLMNAGTKDA